MNRYLVYGTGKSGICAGGLLKRLGKEFIFYDENENIDKRAFYANNTDLFDVEMVLGPLDFGTIGMIDGVVISPGVPLDHKNVITLKNMHKEIIGELELGFEHDKGEVIAITGTNGKTTTTSLVGHILKGTGRKTFVAGNIGDPYTAVCDKTTKDSVTVLEVSSFQLETIKEFAPKVCCILNITPDHLDRHKTLENYIDIKESIVKNLPKDGVCVLNYDDLVLKGFGHKANFQVLFFSSKEELTSGIYIKDNAIYLSVKNKAEKIIDLSELKILGLHNYENAMAAIGMCMAYGVSINDIKTGLKTFEAVPHRLEFVCEKEKVKYYNDSKGTNPDAAIKAVLAMERPIILIGGGYSKNADYTDWVRTFKGRVKHLILLGESAKAIAKCADANGFSDYSFADTFDEAVDYAKNRAYAGDCVLLSPACASWDMFKNFEERGDRFKELVKG